MRTITESTSFFPVSRIGACAMVVAILLISPASAALLEYDEYLQRANAAKARGDWESAASQFAQAINHPDLPADGTQRSAVNLEYGRAIGVLCHYDEAEKYLLRAKEIAQKAGSSLFPSLLELGAISVAQKKYPGAVGYFSEAAPLIERESRAKSAPAVVADAYEKFALALAATGKPDEAESRRREAAKIRESLPVAAVGVRAAASGGITPYGTQCPKS